MRKSQSLVRSLVPVKVTQKGMARHGMADVPLQRHTSEYSPMLRYVPEMIKLDNAPSRHAIMMRSGRFVIFIAFVTPGQGPVSFGSSSSSSSSCRL